MNNTTIGLDIAKNVFQIIMAPDGTVTTIREGPDPCFGMLSPVPASVTVQTPSGLASTTTTSRTVGLTSPRDPLSLTIPSTRTARVTAGSTSAWPRC